MDIATAKTLDGWAARLIGTSPVDTAYRFLCAWAFLLCLFGPPLQAVGALLTYLGAPGVEALRDASAWLLTRTEGIGAVTVVVAVSCLALAGRVHPTASRLYYTHLLCCALFVQLDRYALACSMWAAVAVVAGLGALLRHVNGDWDSGYTYGQTAVMGFLLAILSAGAPLFWLWGERDADSPPPSREPPLTTGTEVRARS